MADAEPAPGREPSVVTLVIKNPSASSPGDFRIEVPIEATVLGVKQRLQRDYAGHPDPARQKLIVSGQLIKDTLSLRDVFRQKNLEEPQVMHLVVAGGHMEASPSSSSSSAGMLTPGPSSRSFSSAASPSPARGPATQGSGSPSPGTGRNLPLPAGPSQADVLSPNSSPAPKAGSSSNPEMTAGPSSAGPQTTPPPMTPPSVSSSQPTAGASSSSAGHSSEAPSDAGPSDAGPSSSAHQGPPLVGGMGPWDPAAMAGQALSPEALNLAMLQMMYGGVALNPFLYNPAMAAMGSPLAAYNAALLNPAAFGGVNPQYPGFMAPMLSPAMVPAMYQNPPGDQQGRQHPGGVFAVPAFPGGPPGMAYAPLPFNVPLGAPLHLVPGGLPLTPPGGPNQAGAQPGDVAGGGLQHPGGPARVPVAQMGPLGAQAVLVQRGNEAGRPGPRRIRIHLRIDLMLILKLAVVVFVFNQERSIQRFLLLSFLAVLVYLYQTGALTPLLRWLSAATQRALGQPLHAPPRVPGQPPPANGQQPGAPRAGGQAEGVGGPDRGRQENVPPVSREAGQSQQQRRPERFNLIREVQLFLLGFITSLLPGFQGPDAMPPPPGEPEVQAPAEGNPNPDRPHQD